MYLKYFVAGMLLTIAFTARNNYFLNSKSLFKDHITELNKLSTKATFYYNSNQIYAFGKTCQILLKKSKEYSKETYTAKANRFLGIYHYNIQRFDSAYFYFYRSGKLYKKIHDNIGMAKNYNSLAAMQIDINDLRGAEHSTKEAILCLRTNPEQYDYFLTLSLSGVTYSKLRNYNKSLFFHNAALNILEKNDFVDGHLNRLITINNIGNVYQDIGEYEIAIQNFKLILEVIDKNIYPDLYAKVVDNYGYSNLKLKRFDEAYRHITLAANMRLKLDVEDLLQSQVHLAEYYIAIKDTAQALNTLNFALKKARQSEIPLHAINCLALLSIIDMKNVQLHLASYIQISDSIYISERDISSAFARIKLETDDLLDEKDVMIYKKSNLVKSATFLLAVLAIIFLIYILKARQNELIFLKNQNVANEEIQNLIIEQQKKLENNRIEIRKQLSRDLHDSVMNKLASIRLNLSLVKYKTDLTTVMSCITYIDKIQDIEIEIRDVVKNLDKFNSPTKGDFDMMLASLLDDNKNIFAGKIQFNTFALSAWENIENEVKVQIYRIVQEGLRNGVKHSRAENIIIHIYNNSDFITILIDDDGVGFDSHILSNGMGLKNIKERVQKLTGSITIKSDSRGTTLHIIIPLLT